jgi:hypothetical protein
MLVLCHGIPHLLITCHILFPFTESKAFSALFYDYTFLDAMLGGPLVTLEWHVLWMQKEKAAYSYGG